MDLKHLQYDTAWSYSHRQPLVTLHLKDEWQLLVTEKASTSGGQSSLSITVWKKPPSSPLVGTLATSGRHEVQISYMKQDIFHVASPLGCLLDTSSKSKVYKLTPFPQKCMQLMEYSFGQFESAVLAVSPPNFLCPSSLLAGWAREAEKSLT